MLPRIAVIALVLLPGSAVALDTSKLDQRGSLTLDMDEIQAVVAQSPKLRGEIGAAVARLSKAPDVILCSGMRFSSAWRELGGLRVGPYVCRFGDRWLEIRTKARISSKGGQAFPDISKEAMRRAADVKEIDPTWTWSDHEPADP